MADERPEAEDPFLTKEDIVAHLKGAMAWLHRARAPADIGPVLNEEKDPEEWLAMEGSPKAKLENEDEEPKTVSYDELIQSWQ